MPEHLPGIRGLVAFRYLDGLASWTPTDPAAYPETGRRVAEQGYAGRLAQIVQGSPGG